MEKIFDEKQQIFEIKAMAKNMLKNPDENLAKEMVSSWYYCFI